MVRQLPSLTQLRVFEAVARHESFKEGAKELCVTQAAVSHQIKALEDALGARLFDRGVRKVTLTPGAETFARELTEAFDKIATARAALTDEGLAGPLRVTLPPFYGNRWLLPRLAGFRESHPEIDLHIDLSFDLADLFHSGFDAAVRYGHGDWPDLVCLPIHSDTVGPVCAPHLVAGRDLPLSPQEIARLTLATSTDTNTDWKDWLAAAGLTDTSGLDLIEYANGVYSFDAALSGHAVCLCDLRSTAADEAAGSLVRLNPLTTKRNKSIYLVFPPHSPRRAKAEAFAAWPNEDAETALAEMMASQGAAVTGEALAR